jgi:hypothetical protein
MGFTLDRDPSVTARRGLQAPLPSDAYDFVRSVIVREQQVGLRAIFFSSLGALGPLLTGVTPLLGVRARDDYTAGIAMHSPLEEGLDKIFPDRTVGHLLSLDTRALRDSVIVPNNISQRVLVFVSREVVMCNQDQTKAKAPPEKVCDKKTRMQWSLDYDPKEIMRRLGRLVLVGKQVEYLNRVRVVSTPEPIVTPPPVAVPMNEFVIAQGTTGKTFTLGGANMQGAAVAMETGAPVTVLPADVVASASGTVLTFKATTRWDAKPGTYAVAVSTTAGQSRLELEVTAVAPIWQEGFAPTATQRDTDQAVTLTLEGRFLKDVDRANLVTVSGGNGKIRVGSVKGEGDDENKAQKTTIELQIPRDAEPGKYSVQVTRPGGGSRSFVFTLIPAKQ